MMSISPARSAASSVENALAVLGPDTDLVAVHDAVRPFIDLPTIEKVIREAAETGAAIVGIVPVDTVKALRKNKVRATVPREGLALAQTPQAFRLGDHGRIAPDRVVELGMQMSV